MGVSGPHCSTEYRHDTCNVHAHCAMCAFAGMRTTGLTRTSPTVRAPARLPPPHPRASPHPHPCVSCLAPNHHHHHHSRHDRGKAHARKWMGSELHSVPSMSNSTPLTREKSTGQRPPPLPLPAVAGGAGAGVAAAAGCCAAAPASPDGMQPSCDTRGNDPHQALRRQGCHGCSRQLVRWTQKQDRSIAVEGLTRHHPPRPLPAAAACRAVVQGPEPRCGCCSARAEVGGCKPLPPTGSVAHTEGCTHGTHRPATRGTIGWRMQAGVARSCLSG